MLDYLWSLVSDHPFITGVIVILILYNIFHRSDDDDSGSSNDDDGFMCNGSSTGCY